jgi:DNA-binding MarR family transcriptional regulator
MTKSTPDDGALALRRLLAVSVTTHEALAARVGLNPTDLRCLLLVTTEAEMTPTRLAELSDLTSGAVTGVLDRLERARYLRREADPEDRRRLIVRLDPDRLGELEASYAPLLEAALGDSAVVVEDDRAAYLTAIADALERETQRLRVETHGGIIDDAYLAPRGDVTRARLVLHTGAPRLNVGAAPFGQQVRMVAETAATRLAVRAAADTDELIRASFVGPPPDVRTTDGTVTMRYRRRMLDVRSREIDAELNPAAAWWIVVENGITDLDLELAEVGVLGVEVHGGANHLRLWLPRPSGTVRIVVEGGISEGRIVRPAAVPVSLEAAGGVSQLEFDGQSRSSSGTPFRAKSRSYDRSPDRYEVEIGGGISSLVIETS